MLSVKRIHTEYFSDRDNIGIYPFENKSGGICT